MNSKDKTWLENTIRNVVQECLTVKVKYEKRRDDKTGKPLAVPELIEQDEYLPSWWIQYLPHYEAAMRGVQETQDKQANTILKLTSEIESLQQGMKAIGDIVFQAENSLKCISAISDKIKEVPKIESINP